MPLLDDFDVFEGKKFSELMKDIYDRSNDKKNKIETIVDSLKDLIITIEDAISVLPMVKECLEVGVHNDDQLVKMASVIQRLVSAKNKINDNDNFGFDAKEMDELMKNASKTSALLRKNDNVMSKDVEKLEEKIKEKLNDIDIDIDIDDFEKEINTENTSLELEKKDLDL